MNKYGNQIIITDNAQLLSLKNADLLFVFVTKNVTYLLTILCVFMVLNTMVRLSDVIVKSDIVLGTKIQLA